MTFMLLVALGATQAALNQDDVYYLDGKSFDCLVASAGTLARGRGDFIQVDLRPCPRPVVTEPSIDSWPPVRTVHPSRIDFVILLTRAEAGCIWTNRKVRERLRQSAGRDRYRLRFPCRI